MPLLMQLFGDEATYLTWGWLSVSVPNLIVILTMVLIFVLALVLPFPRDKRDSNDSEAKS